MTTIAWDGETLAADSQSVTGSAIDHHPMRKVIRRGDVLYAMAGDVAQCLAVVDWLRGGSKPKFEKNNFSVLRIANSEATVYSDDFYPCAEQPPFAMGTGSDFAIGAMDAGADARQAVRIAIKRDPQSGGRVRSYSTKRS